MYIIEDLNLVKNKWSLLLNNSSKHEAGVELLKLVQHAYNSSGLECFVKNIHDVLPSEWKIIDWNNDPNIDACIFYRKSRSYEDFTGYKIQGIGHNGQKESKEKVIAELVRLLNIKGYWIEASNAVRKILLINNVPIIKDETILNRLYKDSNLSMIDDITYSRTLLTGKNNGETIVETTFGKPTFK